MTRTIPVTDLEASFDYYWRILNGPPLESEHRFCHRRWRFDRANIGAKIAIEIDGGTWQRGRHNLEPGYSNDCEKLNRAAALGWMVFRLTAKMLSEKPMEHLTPIIKAIAERESR